DTDLLYRDASVSSWQVNGDTSAHGAHVWIGTDNKVHYDATNLTAQIQALGQGQFFTDTFEYTIKMANGTLSVGTITVKIAGSNDVAVITTTQQAALTELANTTGSTTADGLNGSISFSDDLGDTHTVSNSLVTAVWSGGATLPSGLAATLGSALA